MTADPRTLAAKLRNDLLGVVTYGDVIDAADLVEQVVVPLHDAWLKAKPSCPTCGGQRLIDCATCDGTAMIHPSVECGSCRGEGYFGCPDCSDGVLPFDKWTAGLAALWTQVGLLVEYPPVGPDDPANKMIRSLRQIGGTR